MGYWKFTSAEALAAWEKGGADEVQMCKEAAELSSLPGGKTALKSDLTRSTFCDVNFEAAPYIAKESETVPAGNTGYTSWPEARLPKGIKEEHLAIQKLWSDHIPKTKINNDEHDELRKAMGLERRMLILSGLTFFRHGEAIYVQTGVTLKDGFAPIEIVVSKYAKARRGYNDEKA
ncbi:hypothetical protein [Pantoea sp. GD03673]|uniref:hypothetical protein n=1 Tax=Pantoea sp. GD03673 TaxID=2975364 RepID=UPI002447167D|nr:hypothetical protein [Pantoea sp. GD03673]MDH2066864.1 hypothetical protein [Pantoea sp. GD03673]